MLLVLRQQPDSVYHKADLGDTERSRELYFSGAVMLTCDVNTPTKQHPQVLTALGQPPAGALASLQTVLPN